MKKQKPSGKVACETVSRFCEQVFWLKQIHYICRELFESDNLKPIMEMAAISFFHDLNRILIEYFILEASKITDPATGQQGRYENFSVANIVESIDWSDATLDKIEIVTEKIYAFREKIIPARNELIAHERPIVSIPD